MRVKKIALPFCGKRDESKKLNGRLYSSSCSAGRFALRKSSM